VTVKTVPPASGPELGEIDERIARYDHLVAALAALVFPPTAAVTSGEPMPAGLTAVQVVVLEQETLVAVAVPNFTVVAPATVLKLVPVIVTVVPPVVTPSFG
jgi:hypothetical protein